MKVLAIIPTYNEADILPAVLKHLHDQGVDTYVIDNWSTDDTWAISVRSWVDNKLRGGGCRFPNQPVHVYQWERILHKVEEVALKYSADYDWMMLHDADEIRRGPSGWGWETVSLAHSIELVSTHGYNIIDFQVFNFPPIDNGYIPGNNPEEYFKLYRPKSGYENVAQEKCWKCYSGVRVNLASSGGHRVQYDDDPQEGVKKRVCPPKFIIKHYPIRSQVHGERKVFEERVKRWHLGERGRNWHTQYDGIEPGHSFLADPRDLIKYADANLAVNTAHSALEYRRVLDDVLYLRRVHGEKPTQP